MKTHNKRSFLDDIPNIVVENNIIWAACTFERANVLPPYPFWINDPFIVSGPNFTS